MPKRFLRRSFYQHSAAVFWAVYRAALVVFNRWALLAWAVLVIAVAISFDKQGSLGHQNSQRISDIGKLSRQNSRLARENKQRINEIAKLGRQNKRLIADIQKSRLESCHATYSSFHEVFLPFFPPPAKRTAQQKHDLAKLDHIIAKKIARCQKQVTPPAVKPDKH